MKEADKIDDPEEALSMAISLLILAEAHIRTALKVNSRQTVGRAMIYIRRYLELTK